MTSIRRLTCASLAIGNHAQCCKGSGKGGIVCLTMNRSAASSLLVHNDHVLAVLENDRSQNYAAFVFDFLEYLQPVIAGL